MNLSDLMDVPVEFYRLDNSFLRYEGVDSVSGKEFDIAVLYQSKLDARANETLRNLSNRYECYVFSDGKEIVEESESE